MSLWFNSIYLEGEKVKLIPLERSHKNELVRAAQDGKLWQLWFTSVPSEETVDAYIDFALSEKDQGTAFPFVVIDKKTDRIIGSTRYCNASPEHRRLEIGYTWYSKSFQRTGSNRECKYLLLKHAFETLNCIAVEFRTNWHNQASRVAISGIGAKQDGILRNHRLDADGTLRDTVVFSIIDKEWPGVRKLLEYKLKKYKV